MKTIESHLAERHGRRAVVPKFLQTRQLIAPALVNRTRMQPDRIADHLRILRRQVAVKRPVIRRCADRDHRFDVRFACAGQCASQRSVAGERLEMSVRIDQSHLTGLKVRSQETPALSLAPSVLKSYGNFGASRVASRRVNACAKFCEALSRSVRRASQLASS